MSFNIFQIWDNIGRKLPFAVRRENWNGEFYVVVEDIEIGSWPYGTAYGYPTVNGNYSTHWEYDRKWREDKIIPNAGSYQWVFIDDANLITIKL